MPVPSVFTTTRSSVESAAVKASRRPSGDALIALTARVVVRIVVGVPNDPVAIAKGYRSILHVLAVTATAMAPFVECASQAYGCVLAVRRLAGPAAAPVDGLIGIRHRFMGGSRSDRK